MKKTKKTTQDLISKLENTARTAAVMMDGDEARRVIVDRAMEHITHPNPKYRFLDADYYDVHFDTFLRVKKTLKRLQKLADTECSANLWVRVRERTEEVTLAIQCGRCHRYWQFGELKHRIDTNMKRCLKGGKVVKILPTSRNTKVTFLAPVFDSLEETVGLIEFTADTADDTLFGSIYE